MSAEGRAATLLIDALRLDRQSVDRARRRAYAALELGIGGFLLFGGEREEVRRLVAELREAAGRPLWFAADLERGAGQQFSGCTRLPPPAALAHAPDPSSAARLAGRLTGEEARGLGINWVLAPVLDLDLSYENPIVGTRSFGSDPAAVSRLGRTWIEACQAAGPAACAKHFPGHGRTTSDSHLELPVVEASPDELELDLGPFAEVAPIVATVMVGHVAYPSREPADASEAALEPLPASRDPLLLGKLRRRLGFRGPIVSDALIMGGFAGDAGESVAAVEAVRAGCDLLLYPGDPASVALALERAAEGDPALEARLKAAAALSQELLQEREEATVREAGGAGGPPEGGLRVEADSGAAPATEGGPSEVSGPPAEVGGPPVEVAVEVAALAEESLIAIGTEAGGGEPCALHRERPATVRAVSDDIAVAGARGFGSEFTETLRSLGWEARRAQPSAIGASEAAPRDQTVVLLGVSPQAFKGRAGPSAEAEREVRDELAAGASCLIVFGHVAILRRLGVPGVCAWAPEPIMEQAAARWLGRMAR